MKKINRFGILTFMFLIVFMPFTANSQNLYSPDTVRTFKLYFFDKKWDKKLDEYKKQNSDKRVLARLVVDGVVYDSVGVKYKGNSSYNEQYLKNPFNIRVDYIKKKQNVMGYSELKLSNLFRDPSGIREVLAYNLIGEFLPTPKAGFVELYINDSLKGLYANTEDIDKAFARKYYPYKDGAFFKCEMSGHQMPKGCKIAVADGLTLGFTLDSVCYSNNYELKSKYGWKKMLNLMQVIWYHNDSKSTYYNTVDKYLDVDKTMFMLAFDNLFVNLDSYIWSGRNYYMIEDTNGVFHPVIWDLNMCFGGFSHFYKPDLLPTFPIFMGEDNIYRPLISKLLKVPQYRTLYLEHYKQLVKEIVLSGKLKLLAEKLHTQVAPYILRDPWFYYSDDDFRQSLNAVCKKDIPGILQLMDQRIEYLKTCPELKDVFVK